MAASRIHYDGICRRRLIKAIIRKACAEKKRVPSHRAMGRALGISQPAVTYHMGKIYETTFPTAQAAIAAVEVEK